jgi:hypothetical protein
MHVMIEVEAKFDEFMEEELWDENAKQESAPAAVTSTAALLVAVDRATR